MKDEALKLALEALEYHTAQTRPIQRTEAAILALREALAAPVQEPVARIAELEETVRQLNHALREATETPTFMGEPVISEPAAKIKGVDEYGPMLDWLKHWINFPVGTKLYTTPPAAQLAPVQEPDHPFCDCGRKPHEMHLGWCAHAKSKVEWAGVAQKARYRAYIEAEWLKLNPPAAQPAPAPKGWPSDDLVTEKAKQSGFDLSQMPNMLYTVRGNHAQLVNFAKAMIATPPAAAPVQPVAQSLIDALTHAVEIAEAKRPGAWDDLLQYRALLATPPTQPAPAAAPVPLTESQQIAEALRQRGLTLLKTSTGYTVLKLGPVQAQATPPAAPAQPAPVQVLQRYSPDGEGGMELDSLGAYVKHQDVTTPPAAKRQWVGLTDEEKRNICRVGPVYAPDGVVTRRPLEYRKELEGVALMAVRKAEAKLKEKNT